MTGEAHDMQKNGHFEKIIKAIDEQRSDLVDLCLQLGNTPSHHAKEHRLGEAVLQWLAAADIKGELQFITDETSMPCRHSLAPAAARV
jgi:hypothetical protein